MTTQDFGCFLIPAWSKSSRHRSHTREIPGQAHRLRAGANEKERVEGKVSHILKQRVDLKWKQVPSFCHVYCKQSQVGSVTCRVPHGIRNLRPLRRYQFVFILLWIVLWIDFNCKLQLLPIQGNIKMMISHLHSLSTFTVWYTVSCLWLLDMVIFIGNKKLEQGSLWLMFKTERMLSHFQITMIV